MAHEVLMWEDLVEMNDTQFMFLYIFIILCILTLCGIGLWEIYKAFKTRKTIRLKPADASDAFVKELEESSVQVEKTVNQLRADKGYPTFSWEIMEPCRRHKLQLDHAEMAYTEGFKTYVFSCVNDGCQYESRILKKNFWADPNTSEVDPEWMRNMERYIFEKNRREFNKVLTHMFTS